MKTCLRFLFACMFVALGLNASAQTWVGAEVAAGDYYLLNVGTQEFLCGGNNWGTKASSGMKGIYVTLASQGEGKYTISTDKVYSGCYLGENGFVDNGTSYAWTFALVDAEKKIYSISKGGSNFVGNTSPAKGCAFDVDLANASSTGAQWMLISKANLQASLASATYENGIDVTFLITNPDMARIAAKRGWSWSGKEFNLYGENSENNYQREGFELYAGWDSGQPSNLSQMITGIPNGKYRLMVDGFYRDGGNGEACTDHKNGTESLDMKLYINETTASIMSVFEGAGKNGSVGADTELGKVPNNAVEAVSYFNAGLYKDNYVEAMVTNGQMTMGLKNDARTANNWGAFRNFRLYYYGVDLTELKNTLTALMTEADDYYDTYKAMNYYLAALAAAHANAQTALNGTQAEIEAAIEELRTALTEAKASEEVKQKAMAAAAYNNSVMDNAEPVSVNPDDYAAAITKVNMLPWSETATMEEAEAALAELEAARQVFVLGAYPMDPTNGFDLTFMIDDAAVTDAAKWTNGRTEQNQQYEGAPDNKYLDLWDSKTDMSRIITELPDGIYVLTAATRASADIAEAYIYGQGLGEKVTAATHKVGSSGNELGGGWGWTTTDSILVAGGKLTIGFYADASNSKWAGADDFKLILARGLNDEEMMQMELAKFEQAQEELKALIAEAQALINDETNIGTGAFQRNQDDLDMLSMYVQMAQFAATGSIGDVGGADMVNMYASYVSMGINYAKMLNAPTTDEAFEVKITTNDSYVFKNLPLTFQEDGKGGAFFNTKMNNRNYAQSVIFTATGELNEYTMSTVNAAGQMIYIATNKTANNEGNTSQIRLTNDAEKALKVVVERTAEEGVYKLFNTEAKAYLGCQDDNAEKNGGLYTTNSHSTFTITSVDKVKVEVNITEAGWATLMLPYAAEIPADLTVYTCQEAAAAEGGYSVLTLTEVESIEANKPYVVSGAADTEVTFEGWGAAYAMEYSNGMLTGTFAEKTAAAGSYVLQNQNGIVGFYLVEEGAEPTVKANRAWMNYSEAAGIKAFVFDGMLTGINQIESNDALVDVYTLQGVLVRKDVKKSAALKGLNKGAYIVGGVKTLVK